MLKVMRDAEVVVIAEVIEVHPPLYHFWSGLVPNFQHVRYRVIKVLKGKVKKNEIDAGHYVVLNSLTANKERPRLSQELFKPGNRLVLALSREKDDKCRLKNPEQNIEAFCSPSENYGAILAEPELIDKIQQALKEI
jgi:hypothetical protein